jgi:hypothetical protein
MKRLYILVGVLVAMAGLFALQQQVLDVRSVTPRPTVSTLAPSSTPVTSTNPNVEYVSPTPILTTPSPSLAPAITSPVAAVKLNVPFTIQAPDGQWVEPWKEGCEEAALLMADAFNKGNQSATLPVAETKEQIKKMVDWQIERFGAHKDIGADEMAIVAKEYLGYANVRVKHNATLNDIRDELRNGNPVIVPAAGRLLSNPYFTPPGPVYHVFLIKGFEPGGFIANENGTRQGNGYLYTDAIMQQALHDYRSGDAIVDGDMAYVVLEK